MKKIFSELLHLRNSVKTVVLFSVALCGFISSTAYALDVNKAKVAPIIDGILSENEWDNAKWQPLDQLILGVQPSEKDFKGQFKLLWNENALYLIAEITDDILFDQHADPLHFYWDDDCLEVFIDENRSGGDHQQNYNAFAYHVALDNQAVDIGEQRPDGSLNFVLLNDHIKSQWRRSSEAPNKIIWEMAINIYDDSFSDKKPAKPMVLTANKLMGFMLAYCDNDGSENRESFIGSTFIEAVDGDKNLGYKNASVFGEIKLVE